MEGHDSSESRQVQRWVEVDGKHERGADAGEGRGRELTRASGPDLAERGRDSARYGSAVRRRVALGKECVRGKMVPRRPLSAPLDARTGQLSTNTFCLEG